MIRTLQEGDLPDVTRLLTTFTSLAIGRLPDDDIIDRIPDVFWEWRDSTLVSVKGDEVGGIISGYFAKHPLEARLVLYETVWYSEDNSGLRLLKAFEDLAADKDASIILTTLSRDGAPNPGRLLERRGYKEIERHYELRR